MCGIALIVSGVRIDLSALLPSYISPPPSDSSQVCLPTLQVDDFIAALRRRGPDHLGVNNVYLQLKTSSYSGSEEIVPIFNVEETTNRVQTFSGTKNDCFTSIEVVQNDDFSVAKSVAALQFVGATLQLRGTTPVYQPLGDTSGNVLVYNGEIFGGLLIDSNSNDGEILMRALERYCFCSCDTHGNACHCIEKGKTSIVQLLSTLKGPWALIYWQDKTKTLWFGRDALGRRSLLVHWPTLDDSRLLLSSVSPPSSVKKTSDFEVEDLTGELNYWEELPCGIYNLNLYTSQINTCMSGEIRKHEWADAVSNELISWDRKFVEPSSNEIRSHNVLGGRGQHVIHPIHENGHSSKLRDQRNFIVENIKLNAENPTSLAYNACSPGVHPSLSLPAHKVLAALKESVMRRTTLNTLYLTTLGENKHKKTVPVAVLFSGGLDSMILAALLDKCLDPCYEIDLLNISFDGQLAPDRISGRKGEKELKRIAPSRRWNFVEIDANLSRLTAETKHVMSLINPSKTYMDLNIGIALWLAAGGDGWIREGSANNEEQYHKQFKYKSDAKILLVGSGADEQCAGYSRHKTKYKRGGWLALHEEMKLDMQRIWKRNLGRDDRCISDNGKEARFPFLDEDVIKTLLQIPLWEIANLDEPIGIGDKMILREVARLLGLEQAAFLPKRAIQFGSRIARESNRQNFGSNRAANQASAGSVVIDAKFE